MQSRTKKIVVLAAMAGTLLQFGGCLGTLAQLTAAQIIAGQVAGLVPDLTTLLGGTTTPAG